VRDAVTYHADPIKAYEYLASGVPIVATDLPALRRLQPLVRLAASCEAFMSQIEAALVEGRAAHQVARQAEARRHDWSARFAEVERLLLEHLPA
jgi:teichuronic acid biosynthesis glycosyltransferase TuaH